jgi:hypothetical protein
MEGAWGLQMRNTGEVDESEKELAELERLVDEMVQGSGDGSDEAPLTLDELNRLLDDLGPDDEE